MTLDQASLPETPQRPEQLRCENPRAEILRHFLQAVFSKALATYSEHVRVPQREELRGLEGPRPGQEPRQQVQQLHFPLSHHRSRRCACLDPFQVRQDPCAETTLEHASAQEALQKFLFLSEVLPTILECLNPAAHGLKKPLWVRAVSQKLPRLGSEDPRVLPSVPCPLQQALLHPRRQRGDPGPDAPLGVPPHQEPSQQTQPVVQPREYLETVVCLVELPCWVRSLDGLCNIAENR